MNNGTASHFTDAFGSLNMTHTESAKIICHGLSIHVLSEKFWQPAQSSSMAACGVPYTKGYTIFSRKKDLENASICSIYILMSFATFSVIFSAISLFCNQSSIKRPVTINWSACYVCLSWWLDREDC